MKHALYSKFLSALQIVSLVIPAVPAWAQDSNTTQIPAWEYNPGPNPETEMGRKFLDIAAELPEFKLMSEGLNDRLKFRDKYGTMMNRATFEENSVKIAFWGQDATHVAEFAKHTATAGFGGRAQDFARYFGVDKGASFSNAFFSTIYGQYGAFSHPMVELDKLGKPVLRYTSYVDPLLWKMANDPKSEIVKSRNAYIEWLLKNNPDSMRLLVMFGGAARDMIAEFLISRGAEVGTRIEADRLKNIRVPQTKLVNGGGNNEFVVVVDKDGKDLYQELFNQEEKLKEFFRTETAKELVNLEQQLAKAKGEKANEVRYALQDLKAVVEEFNKTGQIRFAYSVPALQTIAQAGFGKVQDKAIDRMVFAKGGIDGSGVVHPGQLGGYDLNKIKINGEVTRNIRGLRLSDGTVITRDILIVEMPHPSSLSRSTPADAAKRVKDSLRVLEPYKAKGWAVEADPGLKNQWNAGQEYRYGRADIRPGYYEFGTPGIRMVSVSSASRMPKNDRVIISGTRGRVGFDQKEIERASKSVPSSYPKAGELWTSRPRLPESRYVFDRGPGEDVAKILKENLPLNEIFKPKKGMTITENGIDALNVKTDAVTGDFGHFRGSFNTSRALILADPHGVDDLITSRAMTGARGQYLNGLMKDLGIGERYLVLKTVPFGMDGATADEWEVVRKQTERYREAAIQRALQNGTVEVIFADGEVAAKEIERITQKLGIDLPVVDIARDGMNPASGIKEAGVEARKLQQFKGKHVYAKPADIPRAHLPWVSRLWEGTGGVDLIVNASDKNRGFAFASVIPEWVVDQEIKPSARVRASISAIVKDLRDANVRLPGEKLSAFVDRAGADAKETIEKLTESLSNRSVETKTSNVVDMTAKPPAKPAIRIAPKMCIDIFKAAN